MSVHTFRFLAVAALADGRLDEEEKPVLLEAALKFGLTRQQAGEIVRELAQGTAKITAVMPEDAAERADLFRSMIGVVAADGRIEPREEALFRKLAPQFNVEEEMVGAMMQAVRDALTRPTQKFKAPEPPPARAARLIPETAMSLDTFRALAAAAFADGSLNAEETSVLIGAAANFGISMGEANGVLLELAENGGASSVELPEDPAQRAALLTSLIEVVVADGEIELREEALLRRLAPGLDVSEAALSEMLTAKLKAAPRTKPAAPPPPPDA